VPLVIKNFKGNYLHVFYTLCEIGEDEITSESKNSDRLVQD